MTLDLPEKSFQELTPRDYAKIDSLLSSPAVKVLWLPADQKTHPYQQNSQYEEELKLMKQLGKKAELQVLFVRLAGYVECLLIHSST